MPKTWRLTTATTTTISNRRRNRRATSPGLSVIGEPVVDTVHPQQVARSAGVKFELAADVLDVCVHGPFVGLDHHAVDGVEGLREAQEGDFALILLDVSMRRMGGMELLDRLRQAPKTRDVPVLVLTTEMQELMIQTAKRMGAAGWIIKPVKMQLLVEAIKKVARPEA